MKTNQFLKTWAVGITAVLAMAACGDKGAEKPADSAAAGAAATTGGCAGL